MQPFVGRELFAAGFVSCWSQLNESCQRQLVQSLEVAFSSPNIPPEILATLLNLVHPFSQYLFFFVYASILLISSFTKCKLLDSCMRFSLFQHLFLGEFCFIRFTLKMP